MLLSARIVFLAALVVWVGAIVCFSFVVAPALFQALPVETAGQALAIIFPRYYGIGCGAGAALVAAAGLLAWHAPEPMPWRFAVGAGLLMLVMTAYAGLVIQPRADALRPHLRHGPDPQVTAQLEFDRLHRLAVQLNALTLLGGLGLLGATAWRLRV